MSTATNRWTSTDHALAYLSRADRVPHRTEGEGVVVELLPAGARRLLDLGTGDGRLLAQALERCSGASAVALDFSDTMLERAASRFEDDPGIAIKRWDLDHPLPDAELGRFDAVISSFAIHHLEHARKRELYAEIFSLLEPGGVFCNLEHVASPTARLHEQFLAVLGDTPETEDPSNKLLDVRTQLDWLRDIGFEDVDCIWKWRELALMTGVTPSTSLGDPPEADYFGTK